MSRGRPIRWSAWLVVFGTLGVAHGRPVAPSFDRAKCAACTLELAKCMARCKDEPPAQQEKSQQKCAEASKKCMPSCGGEPRR